MPEKQSNLRWFQFSLGRICAVLTIGIIICNLSPVIWNTRFSAPRRLPILGPGSIDLGKTTIYLPIRVESASAYYLMDGGTYGVEFIDAKGTMHKIYSNQSMGDLPEHHGEIFLHGPSAVYGGINIGKDEVAERVIYSVMESIEGSQVDTDSSILRIVYPNLREIVWMICRKLG